MWIHFKKLRGDRQGATAIEYGLIAALISVAIIVSATALGGSIGSTFNVISNTVGNALSD